MPVTAQPSAARRALAVLVACLLLGVALIVPAGAEAANPCDTDARLKCPDLVMKPPYDIQVDRKTRPGRILLRAANSIDNVGFGPAELHGYRYAKYAMYARQRIVRQDGSRATFRTKALLTFKFIPEQGRYWKFRDAARFELWRVDANGQRIDPAAVAVGPKQIYCLRDLRRTNPWVPGSPRRFVYPACNRSSRTQRVTLGTSTGWSDIYPFSYHEQWIDVTGLRGRFAYVMIADPRNGLHELYEDNNSAETIVELLSRNRVRVIGPDAGPDGGGGY